MDKQAIKRWTPNCLLGKLKYYRDSYFDPFYNKSYSQEGEDMILKRLLEGGKKGFYVDIGAHHPKRFSNTYYFYKLGWNGINIDPQPGIMKIFNKVRPRDINLELGISTEKCELNYYRFNEPALNSFDRELSLSRVSDKYRIQECIKVKVNSLEGILSEYLPSNQTIDFMSVDTEGHDLTVLQSNDWRIYRPRYILVECLSSSLSKIEDCPIFQLLDKNGYEIYAKTVLTYIYKEKMR